MDRWDSLTAQGSRGHALLLVPAILLVVLAGSATGGLSVGDASFLSGLARTTASLLLLAVAAAAAHALVEWRQEVRHDSIRADIAAGGGLGKRLMV